MKLSFKQRNALILTIISWPLFFIFTCMLTNLSAFDFCPDVRGLPRILLFLFVSLLASIVTVFACGFSKHVKAQNEIMDEYETNGLTDRFILLSQNEIYSMINMNNKQRRKKTYAIYANYVMQLVNAYLLRRDLPGARQAVSLLPLQEMKEMMDITKAFYSNTYQFYFDIHMNICELANDVNGAQYVMREAEALNAKFQGRSPVFDLATLETYAYYYMIMGRFDDAIACAERCFAYRQKFPKATFIGEALYTKILQKQFRIAEAFEHLHKAKALADNPAYRQMTEQLERELTAAQQNANVSG
ncbi:MAG: hypothetical protein K6E50_13605 [Lachnospiraceae bacterium]|nr:hypothetical protein [Lachnospiraceae bacterium]